jgi:exonuclease SbcC
MLVDSLTVRAFRGLRQTTQFDLRAKLTLIHAPNGVGKTSVCDAVEWMFTSEVSRLKNVLNGMKGKAIQNIFEKGTPAFAEGGISLNGETFRVRREGFSEPNRLYILINDRWKQENLNSVLGRLTPQNLPQSAKGLQEFVSRRNWFRAARFLETQGLDLLLDSDDGSNEIRDLVFCDLLGVGELQRRERDLRKIIGFLGGKAWLRKEISSAHKEARTLQENLRQASAQTSAIILETFEDHLSTAAELLQFKSRAKNPRGKLVSTENALASAERQLSLRQSALAFVRARMSTNEALSSEITEAERQQAAKITQQSEVSQSISTMTSVQGDLELDWSTAKSTAEAFTALPFDEVGGRLQSSLSEWLAIGGETESTLDIESLSSSLEEAKRTLANANDRLLMISRCETSLKSWQDAWAREQQAQETLRTLKGPDVPQRSRTNTELHNLRVRLSQLDADYHQLAKPLEEIRAIARRFLDEALKEQHCPLCRVDHHSPSNLRKAIGDGIDEVPESVKALTTEMQALAQQITSAERQLSLWDESDRRIKSLTQDINIARETLSAAEGSLRGLGFSAAALGDERLSANLREMRTTGEQAVREAESAISQRRRTLNAALELQSVGTSLALLAERVRNLQPGLIAEFAIQPPAKWESTLQLMVKRTDAAAAKARKDASASEKRVVETGVELRRLKAINASITLESREMNQKIDALRLQQNEFQTQWRIIADNAPCDFSTVSLHEIKVAQSVEELAGVRQELQTARKLFEEVTKAESDERERTANQQHLSELKMRVRELQALATKREECELGANQLKAAKESFVKTQIQPLCDVITALYVRAQSASFIDRIDSTRDDGPLRWQPRIGEFKLEDTAQMSLGQRQDLALAIFLARARELGGTFFLDEPLLHLDDLNRVALMDVLRTIVVEERSNPLRLVVTTANQSLVRHCREKFSLIAGDPNSPALRVYRLTGDSHSGIVAIEE